MIWLAFEIKETFVFENKLPHPFAESAEADKQLVCVIEAIHAGVTKNYNEYSEKELRKATKTWVRPYKKPVLTHHDIYHGEPIGRVLNAVFTRSESTNTHCIRLVVAITDREAAQKVLDGRYVTVSVGGHAGKALCSICGADWVAAGWCEHRPGQTYDGKLCVAQLKDIEFLEVSFVNAPADENAQVTGILQEGYLFGKESLEDLRNPGSNLLGSEEGYRLMESLGLGGDGKQEDPLLRAHETVHAAWAKDKSEDYARAHMEIVRQMLEAGLEHEMVDDLDALLPPDMAQAEEPEEEDNDFLVILGRARAELEAKEKEIAEAAARIAGLEQEVARLEEEKQSLSKELGDLRKDFEVLKAQAEEDRRQYLEDNAKLAAALHSLLAEQVVLLKIALGQADGDQKEELLEAHLSKTDDVLREALQELSELLINGQKEIYHVDDPTLAVEEPEKESMSMKEALFNLFRGPGLAKKRRK